MVVFFCGSKSNCEAITPDVLSTRAINTPDIQEPRHPGIQVSGIRDFWVPRYHINAGLTGQSKDQDCIYLKISNIAPVHEFLP
jgi:hypothetical protein